MENHPEQRQGEIFIANATKEAANLILWRTKRIGKVAKDKNGVVLKDFLPVFASYKEITDAGIKPFSKNFLHNPNNNF